MPSSHHLRSSLQPPSNLPYTIIHQFPVGTAVENQAVRQSDGAILVTLLSSPDVFLVSPDQSYDPILVAKFPHTIGCTGIVELGHNIFYVSTGNVSLTALTLDSFSIWQVDLTGVDTKSGGGGNTNGGKLAKVTDLPTVGFVNGITVLNKLEGVILLADSFNGVVWSLDVETGKLALAINDTTMAAPETSDAINGIKIHGTELFYTNQFKNTFNKIGIDLKTGHATGPATTLVTSEISPDDFTFDVAGNAWVAGAIGEVAFLSDAAYTTAKSIPVEAIEQAALLKNAQHPTSLQFGIREADLQKGSIYVTTNPNNASVGGGTLSRIDVGSLVSPKSYST